MMNRRDESPREFRLAARSSVEAPQRHHRMMSGLKAELSSPSFNLEKAHSGLNVDEPRLLRLRVAEMAASQRKWSMKDVANALQVDHQTVLYWNQGRSYPRLPMLLILTRLIGCTISDLLHYEA